MDRELVSVIIPSYGKPKTLSRAIDSVIRQTYKNVEVIVVDDNDPGSDDRRLTENLINNYSNNSAVKYIKNNRNMERSFSRNRGVEASDGDYVAFLDNDDEYRPGKIEAQMRAIKLSSGNYTLSYSSYIRKNGDRIVCKNGENRSGNLLVDALARNFFIHIGSNLLVKKSEFQKVGGFNLELSQNEDIDLLCRLFDNGNKIVYSNYVGLIVNLHDVDRKGEYLINATPKYLAYQEPIIEKLEYREKKAVMKLIGLQMLRVSGMRNLEFKHNIYNNYDIQLSDLIVYFWYLIKRAITRRAFGVNMQLLL